MVLRGGRCFCDEAADFARERRNLRDQFLEAHPWVFCKCQILDALNTSLQSQLYRNQSSLMRWVVIAVFAMERQILRRSGGFCESPAGLRFHFFDF